MTLHCERCKKNTLHRKVTEVSQPNDPFTYLACYDCGEIHPQSFTKPQVK